jgi:hypothetical protein
MLLHSDLHRARVLRCKAKLTTSKSRRNTKVLSIQHFYSILLGMLKSDVLLRNCDS